MHVTVPLRMMTWSNTLVTLVNVFLFCFVLLSYLVAVFFYVSCVVQCLLTCSIFRCNWCRDWISGARAHACLCVMFWLHYLLADYFYSTYIMRTQKEIPRTDYLYTSLQPLCFPSGIIPFIPSNSNHTVAVYIQGVPPGMCQTSGECSLS